MRVIQLTKLNQEKLAEFMKTVAEGETRPALYIGFDSDGDPVLHLSDLTWRELAHIKVAFEMHLTRDWLGLLE